MIEFKDEDMINEWLVDLENYVTLLKANIECNKRKCTVVASNTDGFVYKDDIRNAVTNIRSCASMVGRYAAPKEKDGKNE